MKKLAFNIRSYRAFIIPFIVLTIGAVLHFSHAFKANKTEYTLSDSKTGIDSLRNNIDQLHPVFDGLDDLSASYEDMTQSKALLAKSSDELRRELLGQVQQSDRIEFKQELQTMFEVGDHSSFFERQIERAKIKLDMAIVGIGIILIDQVLKGENPTVLTKDHEEFTRYVREQIQQAIASQDKNYKAIVFKGLESSKV